MYIFLHFKSKDAGPPPPPLPPPLRAPSHANYMTGPPPLPPTSSSPTESLQHNENLSNDADSDSGMEVVEEPTLKPSELVRGNHNRTMSTISGMSCLTLSLNFFETMYHPNTTVKFYRIE